MCMNTIDPSAAWSLALLGVTPMGPGLSSALATRGASISHRGRLRSLRTSGPNAIPPPPKRATTLREHEHHAAQAYHQDHEKPAMLSVAATASPPTPGGGGHGSTSTKTGGKDGRQQEPSTYGPGCSGGRRGADGDAKAWRLTGPPPGAGPAEERGTQGRDGDGLRALERGPAEDTGSLKQLQERGHTA